MLNSPNATFSQLPYLQYNWNSDNPVDIQVRNLITLILNYTRINLEPHLTTNSVFRESFYRNILNLRNIDEFSKKINPQINPKVFVFQGQTTGNLAITICTPSEEHIINGLSPEYTDAFNSFMINEYNAGEQFIYIETDIILDTIKVNKICIKKSAIESWSISEWNKSSETSLSSKLNNENRYSRLNESFSSFEKTHLFKRYSEQRQWSIICNILLNIENISIKYILEISDQELVSIKGISANRLKLIKEYKEFLKKAT